MEKTKILIVEDETIVALDIKNALLKLGFEVTDMVTNYDDALRSVSQKKPDILLTDIRLENSKNGVEIAKDIQKIHPTPIIYLTAFSDDVTIIEAAGTSPMGYMLKPFNRDELKSNILLAMYKMRQANEETAPQNAKKLGFGFYFEEKEKILYFKNMIIKLSHKEKEFLGILVGAQGQVVSFEALEHLIWPEGPVSESTLRTLIYRLRTKLEHKLIETIPSIGCKLNLHL